LIQARAIGLMTMIDSGASDDKVIAVATTIPNSVDTWKHAICPRTAY